MRKVSSARGYTMVEVAISMTLFAIGAAAVVAMERTSVQGDADARQQDVATQVAFDWVARLQRDALNWKTVSPTRTTDTRDSNTTYLNNNYVNVTCGTSPAYTPTFVLPGTLSPVVALSGNVDGRSYAFDMFGHDRPPGSTSTVTPPGVVYCAEISECFQDTAVSPATPKLVQATVRVIWPRKIGSAPDPSFCTSASSLAAVDVDGGANTYHGVSMTVLLQGGMGQ